MTQHEGFFTVEISIGLPAQKMNVIPDTGSSNVVVASCVCRETGKCVAGSKCYWAKKSASFGIKLSNGDPSYVELSYGSGDIKSVSSSDVVRIGGVSARMKGGLLLMTEQALDFETPLEGILGLGVPGSAKMADAFDTTNVGHGFLKSAGIERFSMCYNDGAPGVLRFNVAKPSDSLGNFGTVHWGLGLGGVSVAGGKSLPFCRSESKEVWQATPCGAIPDSGTTAITGPKKDILELFGSICNHWPRCLEAAKKSDEPRANVFQVLLSKCESWLDSKDGLDELPAINFQLMGSGGSQKTVSLSGRNYVLQQAQNKTEVVREHIDVFPTPVERFSSEQEKACFAAFDEMDYSTNANGNVWILGMPLFFQYQVGFDASKDSTSVSFSSEKCGSCDKEQKKNTEKLSLLSQSERRHKPRQVYGRLRRTNFDVTQPL